MLVSRAFGGLLLLASALNAADSLVSQAAQRVEQKAALTPGPVAVEYQLRAAQALQAKHPELAAKLLDQVTAALRAKHEWALPSSVVQVLAETAPAQAVALQPQLGPAGTPMLIALLARANHLDEALAVYSSARAKGDLPATAVTSLLPVLGKERPAKGVALLEESIATFSDPLDPAQAWWLANLAPSLGAVYQETLAKGYERVLAAAAAPDYAAQASPKRTGTFQVGAASITTETTRDSLLLLAAARLRSLSPERFAKHADLVARWKIDGPVTVKSLASATGARPAQDPLYARMGKMRGLPTDADRAQLVKELVHDISALPPGATKVGMLRSLGNTATEGDLGKEALGGLATALAAAMRESFPKMIAANEQFAYGDGYLELAKLARYEVLTVPADPALDAATALLALREAVQQEQGFTLKGMDGKTYSLAGLKGRIVLLNFWATWCPPCRKEMPDMEKLYRAYEAKGLTVIAVSDEDRATVEGFLVKNPYTFPVALDENRKVNTAFSVEGIPKSFIFDREGRLAAQAIDMRTEAQFMELLKRAGLE